MKLKLSKLAVALITATLTADAAAAGFALIEQSASGMGNAYAGGAASAEDASTIFFNPAGMSRLPGKQAVLALHAIKAQAEFSDTGSSAASGRPLGAAPAEGGSSAYIPNGYFMMDINPQTQFGLGVNAPFGLETEYPVGWIGRFQALKSRIETINVNPSLSFKIAEGISIGAGVNYQKVKAELTSARSFGAGGEGMTTMNGKDDAWGYNLGALYQMTSGGRAGIAYRSSIKYTVEGNVVVTSPSGAVVLDTPVTAALKTPDIFSLSYFKPLSDTWDVMADVSRTGWNNFNELRIAQTSTGASLQTTPENWRNTWRVAVGVNHHYNAQWTSRAGLAYDQSPVSDSNRTARIPDNDRTWLALGGQYKPTPQSALDIGYAHLFIKNASINNNTGSTGTPSTATVGNLVGNYKSSVNILSVQYTHSF